MTDIIVESQKDILENAKAIAEMTGQSLSSVYKLAEQGIIPCYRVGPKRRGVRFKLSEVLEALRSTNF